jgi:ABC-type transport system involved in multi-copper enzyme maturation permease subunit
VRGKTIWVAWIFAILPILLALTMEKAGKPLDWRELFPFLVMLSGVLAPLFMASALAEEIEDKTFTYLWSRPIPRWSVVIGKLLASIPIAGGIMCGSVAVCFFFSVGGSSDMLLRALAASVAGTTAICMVSSGFAILVPRAGMAVTYGYILVLDLPIGAMPFSLRNLSVTHQIREVAGVGGEDKGAAIALAWMAGIGGFWLAIAFWRLLRAEFSTGDK